MIARALPILALVASIVLMRKWRRLVVPYALLIFCTLLYAATHAEARLSEPLQPLLLILIAGAFIDLMNKLSRVLSAPVIAALAVKSGSRVREPLLTVEPA